MEKNIFTCNNNYLMLALDHRGSLKKILNPTNPEVVSVSEMIDFKQKIIDALYDDISGILLDPDVGLLAYGHRPKPYLLCAEKTGFQVVGEDRVTYLQHTAAELKAKGANGVKLLVYYNPSISAGNTQLHTAKELMLQCRQIDIPFFLDVVTYGYEKIGRSRSEWVLRTVKDFLAEDILPDAFTLEYPGNHDSCKQLTHVLNGLPWVLLTHGYNIDELMTQVRSAKDGGARGFIIGRVLWQDVGSCPTGEWDKFINTTVKKRFNDLVEIFN